MFIKNKNVFVVYRNMSDIGPELQGESKINQQRKLKFPRDYVAKKKSFFKLILTCRFKYNTELDLKNV